MIRTMPTRKVGIEMPPSEPAMTTRLSQARGLADTRTPSPTPTVNAKTMAEAASSAEAGIRSTIRPSAGSRVS
jgi:hypothetical protein